MLKTLAINTEFPYKKLAKETVSCYLESDFKQLEESRSI